MSSTIGVNGELVPYPVSGEVGWGPAGTEFAIQVSQALTKIGLGGSLTPKAVLNVNSTTAGVLIPRMTTNQRDAMFPVPDPLYRGLMIFNLDVNFYQVYDGANWINPTSIMSMSANTIPVANASGNALINSPMTVSGTKVTQTGAMDITGVAGLLGGANLNSQKITSLLAGTVGTDAVNKAQMDAAVAVYSGLLTLAQLQKGFVNFVATTNNDVVSSDGFVYRIASGLIGDNTINVTGCPNVDGTIIYFESVLMTGGAGAVRTFQIHGQTLRSSPTGSLSLSNVFANRSGGTWRLLTV